MTTLVFGYSGQVANELRKQGDVVALSRADADLSDPAACAQIISDMKPAIVINAAAYTAVDAAEDNEELATVINGHAPAAMARSAVALGVPFLHISTDYVFDGTVGDAWKPEDPTNPLSAYGRSKLVGEHGVRAAGGQHAILRTSWVFSAYGNNFVKTILRLAQSRDSLNVVSDQIGGPTSAADIAAALLTISSAMTTGNSSSGTYHFAGVPPTNWADFAREIIVSTGKNMNVTDIAASEYPTPAKRPNNSVMDCTTLLRDFDIVQPNWKVGLSKVLKELENE